MEFSIFKLYSVKLNIYLTEQIDSLVFFWKLSSFDRLFFADRTFITWY